MPRWIITTLGGLILTGILSFSVWAGTNVWEMKQTQAVQEERITQQAKLLAVQQAQIATFQSILGDIRTDVRVIKVLMEEREKRASVGPQGSR